jgi:hypothetical protein
MQEQLVAMTSVTQDLGGRQLFGTLCIVLGICMVLYARKRLHAIAQQLRELDEQHKEDVRQDQPGET